MRITLAAMKAGDIRKKGYFSFGCALLSAIIIPVYHRFFPPVLILWCVLWILENYDNKSLLCGIEDLYKLLVILFLAIYVWQAIGLIYTADRKNGIDFIIMRLPFLLFPIIFLNPGELLKKNIRMILRVFAISTCIYLFFCFLVALAKSIGFSDGMITFKPYPEARYWENYFFASGYFTVKAHPSYIALYTVFSLLTALDSVFDKTIRKPIRIGWFLLFVFLIASLYFLSSRAGLFALVVTVPILVYMRLDNKIRLYGSIFSILVITGVIIVFMSSNSRFDAYAKRIAKASVIEILKFDERGNLWKSSLQVIGRNPILGVGTGDAKAELLKEYNSNNFDLPVNGSYNVHNQYLEFLLEGGAVSLLLFLSIIFSMLLISLKHGSTINFLFVLVAAIFFLSESMLNRLAGISFFTFITFLIYFIENKSFQEKLSRT